MESTFVSLTDRQRIETLKNVFQKGLSTSKEDLAFSVDKLVYLKPFIARLQNADGTNQDLTSRIMVREVIDELLKDILEEVQATERQQVKKSTGKITLEYGLSLLTTSYTEDFYFTSKVA